MLNNETIENNSDLDRNFNNNHGPSSFGSKKTIAIIAALVIVFACSATVFAARDKISNFYQSHFSSPASYYRRVEKRNVNDWETSFMNRYRENYDLIASNSYGTTGSIRLELGENLQEMLKSDFIDLSDLKTAELSFNGGFQDSSMSYSLESKLNDTPLLSLNEYFDFKNAQLYMQVPEISKSYLDLSSSLKDEDMKNLFNSLDSFQDLYPAPENLEKLFDTYSGLFIDSVKDVTKERKTIEAAGAKQKCNALTVKMSGREFYDFLNLVLDTAEKDETTKALVTEFAEALAKNPAFSEDDTLNYEDFQSSINDARSYLEDRKENFEKNENSLTMVVYVDSNGTIIGRDFTVSDNDDDETISLNYKKVVDGSKFGYLLEIIENDTKQLEITGSGNASIKNITGDFVVSIPDAGCTLNIHVENCNLSKLSDGVFEGDLILSSDMEELKGYALKMNVRSNTKETSYKIDISKDNISYGTMTFAFAHTNDLPSTKPYDNDKKINVENESDMAAYISDFDIEKFVNDFAAKSGLNISYDQLATLFALTSGSSPFDADEDYNFDEYDEDYNFDDYNFDDYDFNIDDYDLDEYSDDEDENRDDKFHIDPDENENADVQDVGSEEL